MIKKLNKLLHQLIADSKHSFTDVGHRFSKNGYQWLRNRLTGKTPFTVGEFVGICEVLGVFPSVLIAQTEDRPIPYRQIKRSSLLDKEQETNKQGEIK